MENPELAITAPSIRKLLAVSKNCIINIYTDKNIKNSQLLFSILKLHSIT